MKPGQSIKCEDPSKVIFPEKKPENLYELIIFRQRFNAEDRREADMMIKYGMVVWRMEELVDKYWDMKNHGK